MPPHSSDVAQPCGGSSNYDSFSPAFPSFLCATPNVIPISSFPATPDMQPTNNGATAAGGSNAKKGQVRRNTQNFNTNALTKTFQGPCTPFEGSVVVDKLRTLEGAAGCGQQSGGGPLSSFARRRMGRRKSVSFFPHDQVIEIPRFSDLSPAEFKSVYMTREEMGLIHDECWRLVDLMNQGVEWEDNPGFSKRGLVDLKDESVERRRRMRDQAYKIVFGVQKYNGGSIVKKGVAGGPTACVDVIDVTATLYQKAAARAQEEAYESAWFDAVAAKM